MTDRVELYWCLEEPLVSDFSRIEAHVMAHHMRTFLHMEYLFGTPLHDEVKCPPLSTLTQRIGEVVSGEVKNFR